LYQLNLFLPFRDYYKNLRFFLLRMTTLCEYKVEYQNRWWNSFAPCDRASMKQHAQKWNDVQKQLTSDDYYMSHLPVEIRNQIGLYAVSKYDEKSDLNGNPNLDKSIPMIFLD
jgi:hypothetical protein